jgi:transcription-repair coupling factor (superfamily II helicase)
VNLQLQPRAATLVTDTNKLNEFLDGTTANLRVVKSGPATLAYLFSSLVARSKPAILLASGADYAQLEALIQLFCHETADPLAPAWERSWAALPPFTPADNTAEAWGRRFAALHALGHGHRTRGALVHVDNLVLTWPSDAVTAEASLLLRRNDEMSPDMLLEQAVDWGYSRQPMVTSHGEVAQRGDIVDVFAPGYPLPLRLEFFGDTLEDIRLFDPSSQRSKKDLDEALMLPCGPALLGGEHLGRARALWEKLRKTGELSPAAAVRLEEQAEHLADNRILPGFYYDDAGDLLSRLPSQAVVLQSSGQAVRSRLEECSWMWREHFELEQREHDRRWPRHLVLRSESAALESLSSRRSLVLEDWVLGRERRGVELAESEINDFSDVFWRPEQRRRPFAALMQALDEWRRTKNQVVLSFRSARSRSKFLSLAEGYGLSFETGYHPTATGLFARISPLRRGFELAWRDMVVLSENVLQPEAADRPARRKEAFTGLASLDEIAPADLVVHRDYGLCRYNGLHHLRIGEAKGDYLLLNFDGDDKLYLPVDRLGLVQRYKGPEGANPPLDSMRGARWKNARERARKAVEKIAKELVDMYAYRKVAKGYQYGAVDSLYQEFEATFGFEETPDQAQAIEEVFRDMEAETPMDRLVCGDVGFGKTEVALRAAFRAVLDGRQVALLCPTTVLAEQHYQTFMERMEEFPVKVGMLSRFVAPQRRKQVLGAAGRGEIDVLIGTHRLLSKDVVLPSLGLLILDEEQRFGVKHKERLKELKKSVDALTLTATPIPRTLQLSLSGVRSLSVIETPPVDRKPVTTALMEKSDPELGAILQREMDRGGQVFWVHNRVESLERAAERVRSLAPEARVGMAHGQMREKQLEETMHKFWRQELDILVCTAIVESGLDFPNANTLVVDRADRFGLGQLYQLRGRVGRSERQAFAYFLLDDAERIGEKARKRLKVILEMDYLGAGFKVAMEDLRLRGAGNILGEVQSGHIAKVGLDLFLEMLEEEVRRQKGEGPARTVEPELSFSFEAHIPESYLPDASQRLSYYRRLSSAGAGEVEEVVQELRDRFGPAPEPLQRFLAVLEIKRDLAGLQAVRGELHPARMVVDFGESNEAVQPEALVSWVGGRDGRAKLMPPAKVEVRVDTRGDLLEGLQALAGEIASLRDAAGR